MHHPRPRLGVGDKRDVARFSGTERHGHHLLALRRNDILTVDCNDLKVMAVDVHRVKLGAADVDLTDAHAIAAPNVKRFGERITLAVDAEVVFRSAEDAPRREQHQIVAIVRLFARCHGIDDERAVKAAVELQQIVEMRVIDIRSGVARRELVGERIAGHDRRLAHSRHAIHVGR